MSRVIKFRAWWRADLEPVDDINERPISDLTVDHLIIEQFTGLFDCNGAEIFEGDVVEIHFNKDNRTPRIPDTETTIVKWVDSIAAFQCFLTGNRHKHEVTHYKVLGIKTWEYEIIGNIHQQPELLK